ncbi:SLOG family protein [Priestia sp. YIM B13551]|uniref:SLOG family protein n=1 Tax=Priestia sp. YIM B13551 TaxID=3366306 RepID=UPI00366D5CB6
MNTKQTFRIALTGHRPKDIGGYDFMSPINLTIAMKLREYLLSHLKQGKRIIAISGMALGADQIFAKVALKLKNQGFSVALEAAIPFFGQERLWPEESQKVWNEITDQADFTTYTSTEKNYKPYLMQRRNEYLVDTCDELIAVYNGSGKGGTANCVAYAERKGKSIKRINPLGLVIDVKGDLLKSDCDVMFHQANCQGKMGAGLAKQIAELYKEAYLADINSPLKPEEKLGNFTYANVLSLQNKMIEVVNLYGQFRYGRDEQQTNYGALHAALFSYLEDLQNRIGSLTNLKLGVPKYMGCNLAGGEWSAVKKILEDAAEQFCVRIYTYQR